MEIEKVGGIYPPDIRDRVFQVYKDPAQGHRSLRYTSTLVGIPFTTLSYWNRVEDWQQKIFAEDARVAEQVRRSVEMRLVNEADALMDNLISLAYTGTKDDKVRADATKHLLAIMRFSPVQKVEQDILDNRLVNGAAGAISPMQDMTLEELSERINRQLSGEVIDAEIVGED